MAKSPEAFRSISEAAEELGVAQHVLRFWETKFTFVKPTKTGGARRFYRPADLVILATVRRLLHDEGYSIREVQSLYRQRGAKAFCQPSAPILVVASDGPPTLGGLQAALAGLEAAKARLDSLLLQT